MFLGHLKRQILKRRYTRLELCKEHKLNCLLLKLSSVGLLLFCKKRYDRAVVVQRQVEANTAIKRLIFRKFGAAWVCRTPTDQNLKPAKLLTVAALAVELRVYLALSLV